MLMTEPDFWDDQAAAQKTLRKAKSINTKLELFESMETALEELTILVDMALEEEDDSDPSIEKEAIDGIAKLTADIEKNEFADASVW